jgi:hypothetical protein
MRHAPSKHTQSATTKLTLTLTNELKEALIKKAKQMFGDRRGAISTYTEMVLRRELNMGIEGVEET